MQGRAGHQSWEHQSCTFGFNWLPEHDMNYSSPKFIFWPWIVLKSPWGKCIFVPPDQIIYTWKNFKLCFIRSEPHKKSTKLNFWTNWYFVICKIFFQLFTNENICCYIWNVSRLCRLQIWHTLNSDFRFVFKGNTRMNLRKWVDMILELLWAFPTKPILYVAWNVLLFVSSLILEQNLCSMYKDIFTKSNLHPRYNIYWYFF